VSFGAIFRLDARTLKGLCLLLGVVFLGISVYVWLDGALQANGSELLILIPLLSAVVLIVGALLVPSEPLRLLVLVWFVVLPALFGLVSWLGCTTNLLSMSWCQ